MIFRSTSAALALCASLALFACKSSDSGQDTGSSITKAADQIDLGIKQLEATMLSLHDLTDRPAADLTVQRSAFEKNLSELEGTAKEVSETSAEMQAKGQAYFAQWEQQVASIQNEDIREQSADRRKTIEATFTKVRKEYEESKESFDPVLNDLRDIRTALRADLTLNGIDSLKSTVKKVDKNANKAKDNLRDLSEQFRELGVNLSRNGPPPAPK
jgi:methyl-accepting chemotaxis protein